MARVFSRLGIPAFGYVYEPVAAALAFAARLTRDATVLIADFGGGTTDFSILRLDATSGKTQHKVLGVGGIGIAGDQFDFRLMDHAILPLIGKHTLYQSMGKQLELPRHAFEGVARWSELSFLRTSRQYRELQGMFHTCLEQDKVQRLFNIVDGNKGLALYDAVAKAKQQLSSDAKAVLQFDELGKPEGITITRADFETWIAPDLARIETALEAALESAQCDAPKIDAVFMTGGTSLVPAVRRLFETKFGEAKMHGGEELISVAKGLVDADEQSGLMQLDP